MTPARLQGGWPPPGAPPGGFVPPGGGWPPPGAPPGGGGFAPAPPGGGGFGPPGAPKPITGSPQTMALHAMTLDPTTGLPRGEKPPASTAAVVALVCGILLCLGPLTAIPAIIAGIVARRAHTANPTQVGGGTMAIVGIVLGALNLLGFLAYLAIVVIAALAG